MEPRENEIRTQLENAGVRVFALGRASEDVPIWRVELPGAQGLTAWKVLWSEYSATGLYPVLTGNAAEPPDLVGVVREREGGGLEDLPAELRRSAWIFWLLMTPLRLPLWLWRVGSLLSRELEYVLLLLSPRGGESTDASSRDEVQPEVPGIDDVRCLHDLEGHPHPRVLLLAVETRDPWSVPRLLQFGGFNDCPAPEEHAQTFRRWQKKFGAHIVAVTDDTIEAWVQNPPDTWSAARSLARDQWLYCPEDSRPYAEISEELIGARRWFFWWD